MGNTMNAADLHRVLHNGSLFSGTDDTLPMLNAVRLEFTTDKVIAAATDRFVLGVTRADYNGEEFVALIDRADVLKLAKTAKTAPKHGDRSVDISTETGDYLPGDVRTWVTFAFSTGESITVQTVDHEFPKYRQLFPTEVRTDQAGFNGGVAVNPAYLAKFTKVISEDGRAYQMRLSLGGSGKPVAVGVGQDFVGMIMPVRLPGGYTTPEWSLPDWF